MYNECNVFVFVIQILWKNSVIIPQKFGMFIVVSRSNPIKHKCNVDMIV